MIDTQTFIRFPCIKLLTIKKKLLKALLLNTTKTTNFQIDMLLWTNVPITISSNICITPPCTIAVAHSILFTPQCCFIFTLGLQKS